MKHDQTYSNTVKLHLVWVGNTDKLSPTASLLREVLTTIRSKHQSFSLKGEKQAEALLHKVFSKGHLIVIACMTQFISEENKEQREGLLKEGGIYWNTLGFKIFGTFWANLKRIHIHGKFTLKKQILEFHKIRFHFSFKSWNPLHTRFP